MLLIRKLYIFNTSGKCIVLLDFTSITIEDKYQIQKESDPQMILDFFSAIISFADESIGKGFSKISSPINSVSCKNVIYYFQQIDYFYFILEMDANIDLLQSEDIAELFRRITTIFLKYVKQECNQFPEFSLKNDPQFIEDIKVLVSKTIRMNLYRKN